MSTLNDIWRDLLELRLWPFVAVLGVVAALAPVVFAVRAPNADSGALSPIPVRSEGEPGSLLQASAAPEQRASEASGARDPFARQPSDSATTDSKADNPQGSATPPASAPSGTQGQTSTSSPGFLLGLGSVAGSGSGAGAGADGNNGSGATTPTPPIQSPIPVSSKSWKVGLRTGPIGDTRTIGNAARLTPVPSATRPLAILLGVEATDTGPRAVFLLSADARTSGGGTCLPKRGTCETLTLRAGQRAFLATTLPNGKTAEYVLRVLWLTRTNARSVSTDGDQSVRESRAGRALLREVRALPDPPATLDRWVYSPARNSLTYQAPGVSRTGTILRGGIRPAAQPRDTLRQDTR